MLFCYKTNPEQTKEASRVWINKPMSADHSLCTIAGIWGGDVGPMGPTGDWVVCGPMNASAMRCTLIVTTNF